jgi:hypothetical protein
MIPFSTKAANTTVTFEELPVFSFAQPMRWQSPSSLS